MTAPNWCAHSPLARSPRSKSITDNADATDLFFSRIFLFNYDLSAPAGRWDFHGLTLAGGNPAPYGRKCNPCSFRHWVFLTRIYRIDADATFVGRYCLPDSSHYMLYKSRDFVPGYSRFARYWLPAKTGYDYLLLKSIERRVGAKTIRSKSNIKWQHKIKWNPWKR